MKQIKLQQQKKNPLLIPLYQVDMYEFYSYIFIASTELIKRSLYILSLIHSNTSQSCIDNTRSLHRIVLLRLVSLQTSFFFFLYFIPTTSIESSMCCFPILIARPYINIYSCPYQKISSLI